MGFSDKIYAAAGPWDLLRQFLTKIQSMLSEQEVDADEAEFLLNMILKADRSNHFEMEEFAKLMEYFWVRSISEDEDNDTSWTVFVGLNWIWQRHSY